MANIKIPKQRFEKEIGKLSQEMQEQIALFGTPLEGFDDKEIELEIFPDRPDLLSFQGFKRAFLAFLGKQKGLKTYDIKENTKYVVQIEKEVEKVRPYAVCAVVKGINFTDERIKEIIDIQEKIHNTLGRKRKKLAIGIYPLEEISFPIRFTAMEPDRIKFIPLESDREMSAIEILQKHPTGKAYAHLLAGNIKFPVFIDAKENILSLTPIINSKLTGRVTEKTKDVFVEISGSEDKETQKKALNILVTALADMKGKIHQVTVKEKKHSSISPDLTPEKMKLSLENTNKLLGLNLNEKEVKEYLERMGHDYANNEVISPAWRTDLLHEVDLIEDIAIAYGYDNFLPEIPKISTIGSEDKKAILIRKTAEIITGLNLLEVSNYHLTNKENQYLLMGVPKNKIKDEIEVIESKTEHNILRENLSHLLLKNLSENSDSEYPQNIFEIGKVFENGKEITEHTNLSIALAPGNFTELKQYIQYLQSMLGIVLKITESQTHETHLIEGRIAEIHLNGKKIGSFGEVHPKILKNWKIKMPISIAEMNLDLIFEEIIEMNK